MTAVVALVGAGPGDPELVTLRAEALLAEADIVVADGSLVPLARAFAAPKAEVVAAPDGHAQPEVVLDAARRARTAMVRLYRGDPWLHPAYESERAALDGAGQQFEAVAGVAVEMAAPALAGVAVHVRSLAVACTLGPFGALPAACDPARTLVATGDDPVDMARAMAAVGHGDLPAALVSATSAVPWRGPLREAVHHVAAVVPPVLLVVGAVCGTPGSGSTAVSPSERPGLS